MALFPKEKLTVVPPFTFTGIDYAGPIMTKDKNGHNKA